MTPAGAPIVLAGRVEQYGPQWFAAIDVRDGGPGFTDADLAVAFERSVLYERYRGERSVGTGLGLAIVAGSGRAARRDDRGRTRGRGRCAVHRSPADCALTKAGGESAASTGLALASKQLSMNVLRREAISVTTVLDEIVAGVRADVAARQALLPLDDVKATPPRPAPPATPWPCCGRRASA